MITAAIVTAAQCARHPDRQRFERFDVSVPLMLSLSSDEALKDFHPSRELEGTFLFECLREHLCGDEVWKDCDEWKQLAFA